MDKVRLGIIGAGNMGSGHIGNYQKGLLPEIEITAVADRRKERRDWAKEALGEVVAIFADGHVVSAVRTAGSGDEATQQGVRIAVGHGRDVILKAEVESQAIYADRKVDCGAYTTIIGFLKAFGQRRDGEGGCILAGAVYISA